ncbi:hypothetical protein N7475_004718 [Penicillium sp. IBT 31633x]|nr:hypothetical protein N7475_004718 [Penicillium sp. IBT 31633x]
MSHKVHERIQTGMKSHKIDAFWAPLRLATTAERGPVIDWLRYVYAPLNNRFLSEGGTPSRIFSVNFYREAVAGSLRANLGTLPGGIRARVGHDNHLVDWLYDLVRVMRVTNHSWQAIMPVPAGPGPNAGPAAAPPAAPVAVPVVAPPAAPPAASPAAKSGIRLRFRRPAAPAAAPLTTADVAPPASPPSQAAELLPRSPPAAGTPITSYYDAEEADTRREESPLDQYVDYDMRWLKEPAPILNLDEDYFMTKAMEEAESELGEGGYDVMDDSE